MAGDDTKAPPPMREVLKAQRKDARRKAHRALHEAFLQYLADNKNDRSTGDTLESYRPQAGGGLPNAVREYMESRCDVCTSFEECVASAVNLLDTSEAELRKLAETIPLHSTIYIERPALDLPFDARHRFGALAQHMNNEGVSCDSSDRDVNGTRMYGILLNG
jgi:hypothetical protein